MCMTIYLLSDHKLPVPADAVAYPGLALYPIEPDSQSALLSSIRKITPAAFGYNVCPNGYCGCYFCYETPAVFAERMAQRIMGQGDLMGLIEKVGRVQQELGQEELQRQQKKLSQGGFTLDDFRNLFGQMKTMGMKDVLSRMPGGMADMIPEGEDPEEALGQFQGIIDSMTKEERRNPDVIDMSRRHRIATGSGTEPSSSTASWKARMLNFEPNAFSARSRLRQMSFAPR